MLSGKKTYLVGIWMIIQAIVPALIDRDVSKVDWVGVQGGFGLIFLRQGVAKTAEPKS